VYYMPLIDTHNSDTMAAPNPSWDKLFSNKDIWVNHILPFVGPGHYSFLAGVNKQWKRYYLAYWETIQDPPKVLLFVFMASGTEVFRPATSTDTFHHAIFGSLSCAEYWLSHGDSARWSNLVCTLIAKTGNQQVLQWAFQQNLPWDSSTCSTAAKFGHLNVLIYAHENGCPWDINTCNEAAAHGYLEILKYAHENGCPWSFDTCSKAAQNGHLDVLMYAHENGCPWDKTTRHMAAVNGHMEVLKYAHENDCPCWKYGSKFA
jgi:hypothetical protein